MSLSICNKLSQVGTVPQLVGTIKCQFALPGLVRTDVPKHKEKIEKRLLQRLNNLNMHCQSKPSALLSQCNRAKEETQFLIEIKVYFSDPSQENPLAAARWFTNAGRSLTKIIRGSQSLNSLYAGISTNIKPSYLFVLEDALGLYEQKSA